MALELVVAVADNDVVGRDNRLPWRMPADLRHFKSLTMGKPVLMGRKTYDSIGGPLKGRLNLVLTRGAVFKQAECVVVRSLEDAQRIAAGEVLMVIGGAEVYRQTLPLASRIHLTQVHTQIDDGDAFFSGWRDDRWQEISRERHEADPLNLFAFSFVCLQARA